MRDARDELKEAIELARVSNNNTEANLWLNSNNPLDRFKKVELKTLDTDYQPGKLDNLETTDEIKDWTRAKGKTLEVPKTPIKYSESIINQSLNEDKKLAVLKNAISSAEEFVF